jgi:hypothetical protein
MEPYKDLKYYTLKDKISELRTFSDVGNTDILSTGIESLNGIFMLKKGYPIFIGGAPFSGKTEFAFEVQMNTSLMYGWKHFIYCGEGGNVEHIFHELLHKFMQKTYKQATEKEKMRAEYFISEHFVIANHDMDFSINDFYDEVAKAEKDLKIKFDTTMFDPFNDIKENLGDYGGREDKFLADVLKIVRTSSKMNKRIDIIVNHIADVRTITDSNGNRYMPPALPNEWAGGRTWWRRAFTMLLVYRPPTFLTDINGVNYLENETHIINQKAKPKGVGRIGKASIFWDWQKNRFYSIVQGRTLNPCQPLSDAKLSDIKPNINFYEPRENE